jgi:hypothetical protein|tara:strand:- start:1143 stop:1901 length:759 start_codon:yes stop_codon:yes gene_type:complete
MKTVPKIIHQVWIGPNRPAGLMDRVKRLHPDCEYMLWNEDSIVLDDLITKDKFKETSYFGERGDIFSYEMLYKYGGIYIDADTFVIKNLYPFFECSFTSLHDTVGTGFYQSGIIGFTKGHSAIKDIINRITNTELADNKYIQDTTSNGVFTSVVDNFNNKVSDDKKIKIYPCETFIPLSIGWYLNKPREVAPWEDNNNFQTVINKMFSVDPKEVISMAESSGSFTHHVWGSMIGYDSYLMKQYCDIADSLEV